MKPYCLLVALLLSLACIASPRTIKIDVSQIQDGRLSELVDEFSIIRLEVPEDIIMSEITKVIIEGDNVFVWLFHLHIIHRFDISGRYLNHIGFEGAGEVLMACGSDNDITRFEIDPATKEVVVLNAPQKKVYFFDYSGKQKQEINLKYNGYNGLTLIDDSSILLSCNNSPGSNSKNSLTLIERKKGKILYELLPIPENRISTITLTAIVPLYRYRDTVMYQPAFEGNTLYEIHNETAIQRYMIDFGEKWPSEQFFNKFYQERNPNKVAELSAGDKYVCFPNIQENLNFISVNFTYKQGQYQAFVDKTAGYAVYLYSPERCDFSSPVGMTADGKFISAVYGRNGEKALVLYTLKSK